MTTGHDIVGALRRFWWVILLCGVIAVFIGYVVTPDPQYITDFRTTVLIPGDTEETGNSERPELMVLDDLGPFASSWAFAEMVANEIGDGITVDDVYGMISGSRYSRIATIQVAGDDRAMVRDVANAASEVFPTAVNSYLVADESESARVQMIDPPREPVRDATVKWVRIGAIALLTMGGVSVLAILATPPGDGAASGKIRE